MTSDRPDNCYTVPHMRISCPNGKRIDYVLYKSPFAITVKECKVMMNGIENSNGLNYSDHSAVFARLNVDVNSKSNIPEYTSRQHTTLQKSLDVVEAGIGAMTASGWFNIAALIAIAVVWLAVFDLESHHPPFMIPVMLLRLLLTVMFIYWLWTGVIGAKMERKALLAVKSHMDIALKQFK